MTAERLRQMAKEAYMAWYHMKVASHLTNEQKEAIMHKVSDMTLEEPIWMDRDTNFVEQFPELKPYSSNGFISGLQLCAVMEAIFTEFHPEAELAK